MSIIPSLAPDQIQALITHLAATGHQICFVDADWQQQSSPFGLTVDESSQNIVSRISEPTALITRIANQSGEDPEGLEFATAHDLMNDDGSVTPAHVFCLPILAQDQSLYMLAIYANQDQSLEEFKAGFLALSNHELRTPLTMISTGIQILQSELQGNESKLVKKFMGIIKDGSIRLLETFNKVLDLASLVSVKQPRELVTFSLRRLILELMESRNELGDDREWHHNITEDSCLIQCDKEILSTAIASLLENAVSYSGQGDRISIILAKDPKLNQAFLKITDMGKGMSEKQLSKSFDTFYHGERIQEKHTPGLGLGLPLAKRIISLHNGRIHLDSKRGVGTSCTVKLPLSNTVQADWN